LICYHSKISDNFKPQTTNYKQSMGVLKQIAEYLYLRKPDPNRPKSDFIKKMHWINRTSILLFLLALIIMLIKFLSR